MYPYQHHSWETSSPLKHGPCGASKVYLVTHWINCLVTMGRESSELLRVGVIPTQLPLRGRRWDYYIQLTEKGTITEGG